MRSSLSIPIVVSFAITLILAGCAEKSTSPGVGDSDRAVTMDDLVIEEDFKFPASKVVTLDLSVARNGGTPLPGIRFDVYDGDPDNGAGLILSAASDAQGNYSNQIRVAGHVSEIFVLTRFGKSGYSAEAGTVDHMVIAPF